ncbi:MAG: bacterioferritin [bacterium]|nr:bacterioferritin [bacterium]
MKSPDQNIHLLNAVLARELVMINQTFLHARIAKNWGLKALNEKEYHFSIASMKRADRLIERVLFLEGLPNLQNLGSLHIGEQVEEILQGDLQICQEERSLLVKNIALLEANADFVSRELLEQVLESIESQIDWLETQQDLVEKMGLENYQQHLSRE